MNKDPEDRLVKGQSFKSLNSAHPAVYSTGILILIEEVIICLYEYS